MSSFQGTAAWLRGQWSNPSDIFTIMLIIGGDIVQIAIAQLCSGPVPYLTPVSFSFGWVTYAISAMRSAVGENRLMPKPELDSILVNAKSGYARKNCSWLLSRILRDFDYWRGPLCDQEKVERLAMLRAQNGDQRARLKQNLDDVALTTQEKQEAQKKLNKLPPDECIRIGLRITVWEVDQGTGRGSGDWIYWIGIGVSALQLGISIIPWACYGEWYTFLVTVSGTVLAYLSGMLPQWVEEKRGVRSLTESKTIFLTEGNGADEILMIVCHPGNLDLEALASPQREKRNPNATRTLSCLLAVLWVAFLITTAGWEQHTWFLVGIGIIGILHNVGVAGMSRTPEAWGINLQYKQTIAEAKVMRALWCLEDFHPGAGSALIQEFFPGKLRSREELLWKYAERRAKALEDVVQHDNVPNNARPWDMPPLLRPEGASDDTDVPKR